MGVLSVIAGVLMAVGPPLAYSDQYISICRKHTSAGFSTDICALLIIANITRCIYWLGERFQTYLLVQSILMIGAQFGLLYVCIVYRPSSFYENRSRRPGNFWQWENFAAYLEFTALLILIHCAMFLLLHKWDVYVQALGFIALGLEATLPIPQLLSNFEHKSTAGFRLTVLAGWFVGDAVKSIYFFVTPDNGLAFKACAVFQLSIDFCLCIQTFLYRQKTAEDLAERAGLRAHQGVAGAESLLRTGEGAEGQGDEDEDEERAVGGAQRAKDQRAYRDHERANV
ncbi:hypothetical protein JCM6882_007471 [Rhodosporidiobolus microsporus]